MGFVLGLIAGLAYGLSAFAGAFITVPLLVVGAGVGLHASLPVALLASGICAAIAAGDAARARQCDVFWVATFLVGAVPVALFGAWAAQIIPEKQLATVFLISAIVFGPLWLNTGRRFRRSLAPSPAALLRAPKLALMVPNDGHDNDDSVRRLDRLGAFLAGAGCGMLTALCAAPGSRIGWLTLDRRMPGQPYLVVGTLAFAVAILAMLEAGLQFFFAPSAPGYTSGLFVLGAVAGMGLARRIEPLLGVRISHTVVGVAVIVGALILWITVTTDWHAA